MREAENRVARFLSLARQGAIKGSIIIHVMADGSLCASVYGCFDSSQDIRELAERISHLNGDA